MQGIQKIITFKLSGQYVNVFGIDSMLAVIKFSKYLFGLVT